MSFDVIIAGAGIVGAACAWECARAGLRVGVVEPRMVGGGATAAGMGHLVVMDDSPAQLALTRYSQVLWRSLAEHLPDDCEYRECGTLWIAADADEMAEVNRKAALLQSHGIPSEVLDAQQLTEIEPLLRQGLAGALRVPQDGVAYPPNVARFLLAQAVESGAKVFLGQKITGLSARGAELSDGTALTTNAVVNATGHWSPALTPQIPVKPRKGHLLITDRYPQSVRHQLVELGYLKNAHAVAADSVSFNVQPRATGQLLIGSSRQYDATGPEVEPHILQAMLRRVTEYMPALAQMSVLRVWTGFRAATPNHLPLIGPVAQESPKPKLYLATGHEGLGVTTAPGTAQILADMLLGCETAIPADPYSPINFA